MNGPSLPISTDILSRLQRIRASVRRRMVIYGMLAVGGGGMIAFLTVVGLDWLLRLPPLLRIVVTLIFVAGFFASSFHWIIKPLRASVGLDEVAARLEHFFPNLTDRLSTTVNFLQRSETESPRMVAEVVQSTEDLLRTIPLEGALTVRRMMWLALAVLAGALSLATLGATAPGWIRTGLIRYAFPFGSTQWPRRTNVIPLSKQVTVAMGESAALAMRVERGLTDTLRGLVHLRQADGTETTLTMQREPDGLYTATIDAVTTDMTFWFEAGDDETLRQPGSIRVVRRPELVEAHAIIMSPSYAAVPGRRVESLAEGPVRASVGSKAEIRVRTSKPVRTHNASGRVGLMMENGEAIPLQVSANEPLLLSAALDISANLSFRVELEDENGFRNFGAPLYTILAEPDHPPVVVIAQPRADVEVTSRGSVDIVVRTEDDFGLAALQLVTERQSSDQIVRTDLLAHWTRLDDESRVRGEAKWTMKLEGWPSAPGDVFVVTAAATDNCPTVQDGQTTRSTPVRIKVISDTEFENRLREELGAVEERIRQAALEQTELADRTQALARTEENPAPLSDREVESAAALASQQSRLGRRVTDLSRRLAELSTQQLRNRPDDAEGNAQLKTLSDRLDDVVETAMNPAAQSLTQASQRSAPEQQQELLRQAADKEQAAAEKLKGLLKDLARWGTLQNVVTKTRDLLDRQTTLAQQTARIGQSTLGKSTDALTPDEAAGLKRSQRQQEQLARDAEQLLARMEQLAGSTSQKDAAAAQAVEGAVRAASAQDLVKKLDSAAEAIGDNKTSAASAEQKAAMSALRNMLDAMRERDERELEDLQKQLQKAEDQVAELIREQETIMQRSLVLAEADAAEKPAAETQPAADAVAALAELALEQGRIKRNTRVLGEELSDSERVAAAGRLVRDAVAPMAQAEERLSVEKAASATLVQAEAITLLRTALEKLAQLTAEADQEALIRSLTEVREKLEELVAGQTEINDAALRLSEAAKSAGKLSRSEVREATRLALRETELRNTLNELLPDLARVPVYEWVLTRVAGWMDSVRSGFENRRIDEDLIFTADRIVREIQKLIAAIAHTQQLPLKKEFVERESGEGGEGKAAKSKPVPPIAELLVLKTMQEDLNDRTRRYKVPEEADQPTERQLREIQVLGEDQKEVRRLTELLTGRARTEVERP